MKITQCLRRQHIGFMFKKHWVVQGKRVPIETGVEEHLKSMNIPVIDANEFVKEETDIHEKVNVIGMYEKPLPLDYNHPNYKTRPCYTLDNKSVLLEGINQAQVLTKTVVCEDKLPARIEELAQVEVPSAINECVKKAILSANVFDCEQEKLPKIKDPNRPAVNFPRILGITDRKRNMIITNRLIQLIERSSNTDSVLSKFVTNDVNSTFTFEKEQDLIQLQEKSNILVTSEQPLTYDDKVKSEDLKDIPDLYPVKHTVTLTTQHFYDESSTYPIAPAATKKHPHTTWLHFNRTEVANLFETPVTEQQIFGRSLTHTFAVAAAYAKQHFGDNVKILPEPVFLNCLQTDGQNFHIGVLELKTLDLSGNEGPKNVWYCKHNIQMYGTSRYLAGIPVIEKYNPKAYAYINAVYNS